jgi:hypothetical protein
MDPLRLLCCAVDEAALVGSPLEMAMGEEDSKRAAIYIAGGRRRRLDEAGAAEGVKCRVATSGGSTGWRFAARPAISVDWARFSWQRQRERPVKE